MRNFCFVFYYAISYITALNISCSVLSSVYLYSSQHYNISIKNPPLTQFAVIGDFNSTPDITYFSTNQTWKSSLSLYDLRSYNLRLPYLLTTKLKKSGSYTFSICLFDSDSKENSCELDYQSYESESSENSVDSAAIDLHTTHNLDKEISDSSSSIKAIVISDNEQKFFNVKGYSLTYVYVKSSAWRYKSINDGVQIFHSNNGSTIPSFFNSWTTQNLNKDFISKNDTYHFLTYFCTTSTNCSFTVSTQLNSNLFKVLVLTFFFIVVVFLSILGLCSLLIRTFLLKESVRRIKKEDIEKLTFVMNYERKDKTENCSICLQESKEDDKIRVIKKCKHKFHVNCIDPWFLIKSTCPNCNTNIT